MNNGPDLSREYPVRPLFGVGAVIVDQGRVALVRRGKNPKKGEWSIPGGLVNLGEPIAEAVAREALEETGLDVEPRALVELAEGIFRDDSGEIRYHYIVADYLCLVSGGELKAGSDALEAVWVARCDLHRYSLDPLTIQVILKAFARHQS
jgi:8-oxo-dGTP diphosphatase